MAVRRIRTDLTGSAHIAAVNNAPTGTNANLIVSNNAGLTVPTLTNYTTLTDALNLVITALQAHGVLNSA
jgi:hypothetical protein